MPIGTDGLSVRPLSNTYDGVAWAGSSVSALPSVPGSIPPAGVAQIYCKKSQRGLPQCWLSSRKAAEAGTPRCWPLVCWVSRILRETALPEPLQIRELIFEVPRLRDGCNASGHDDRPLPLRLGGVGVQATGAVRFSMVRLYPLATLMTQVERCGARFGRSVSRITRPCSA